MSRWRIKSEKPHSIEEQTTCDPTVTAPTVLFARCVSPQDAGTTCSHVSFLDDALIRDSNLETETSTSLSGLGSLCLHFSTCGALRSTHSGAATFRREETEEPQDMDDDDWVTIATARSMSSESSWQLRKQLCVSTEEDADASVVLEDACSDLWSVKLVSELGDLEDQFLGASIPVRVTISTEKGSLLCSNGEGNSAGSLFIASASDESISSSCFWDLVRARENQQDIDSEPCVWLRRSLRPYDLFDGRYLSAVANGNDGSPPALTFLPWSHDMSASCWNFGYKQSWMHQNFEAREDFQIERNLEAVMPSETMEGEAMEGSEVEGEAEAAPHIWLMASPKYFKALQRLLSRFHRAGESIRVSVRWVPEFKDVNMRGFDFAGDLHSRRVYAFNYLKLLFLYEAFLEAVQSPSLVVVMDLDVQVRRGWKNTLAKCLEAAEICFLQQAAFGDRWQQANSGVLVWRSAAAVGAFLQAMVARMHGHEVLTRLLPSKDVMAYEQLWMNYELHRTTKLAAKWEAEKHGETHVSEQLEREKNIGEHLDGFGGGDLHAKSTVATLIWGIYNPLVAYIGMFLTTGIFTTTVHHATSSKAKLNEKLRFMDAAEQFSSDLRDWCPVHPSGMPEIVGPLLEFCYLFSGVDPHFGPLLEHYRLRKGFSSVDNLAVVNHLQSRSGKTRVWVHSVVNFNNGAYKFYLQKRRNSSWGLADLYLHPPY